MVLIFHLEIQKGNFWFQDTQKVIPSIQFELLINFSRNTALQLACMKQRFHVIDALLQQKANQNETNIYGWNCIISAVNYFHEDSAIILLLLLQVTVLHILKSLLSNLILLTF